MSLPELLPCPFCGGPALLKRNDNNLVQCNSLECLAYTVVGTANDWNRRTCDARIAELEARLERMKEALLQIKSFNEDIRDGKMNYRPEDHLFYVNRALTSIPGLEVVDEPNASPHASTAHVISGDSQESLRQGEHGGEAPSPEAGGMPLTDPIMFTMRVALEEWQNVPEDAIAGCTSAAERSAASRSVLPVSPAPIAQQADTQKTDALYFPYGKKATACANVGHEQGYEHAASLEGRLNAALREQADKLNAAYLAGFTYAGEGCNTEVYPYDNPDYPPDMDEEWIDARDKALSALSSSMADQDRRAQADR